MPYPYIPETLERLAVPLEGLHPYHGNARRGRIPEIVDSLRFHSQYRPIVVNTREVSGHRNTILAGNHTYHAMCALRDAPIPGEPTATHIAVTFVDVDADEAARINLIDNKLSDDGEYDTDALLAQLQDLPDLEGSGYRQDELDALLASLTPIREPLTDPDDVPEPPATPTTQPGDLYMLGSHRLLCGDSTDIAAVEQLMGGKLADMVWTDPPYGVAYVGGAKKREGIENDSLDEEALSALLRDSLTTAWGVSRAGASWYVAAPPGPLHHVFGAVLRDLNVWRQTLIWAKNNFAGGWSDYRYQHEPLFYGWKQGADRHFTAGRSESSLWEIDKPQRSDEHPTMKPVELIERAITNSSEPGWLVYEPFAGSGSTLIAAEKTGRVCYAMEIDPQYADVIVRRWEEYTGETAERLESATATPAAAS